jgi:hypothetical protein
MIPLHGIRSGQRSAARTLLTVLARMTLLSLSMAMAESPDRGGRSSLQVTAGRGIYRNQVQVSVADHELSELYYTTNGALPTPEAGRRWTNPFEVRSTTILRLAHRDANLPFPPRHLAAERRGISRGLGINKRKAGCGRL